MHEDHGPFVPADLARPILQICLVLQESQAILLSQFFLFGYSPFGSVLEELDSKVLVYHALMNVPSWKFSLWISAFMIPSSIEAGLRNT